MRDESAGFAILILLLYLFYLTLVMIF